MMYTYLSEWNLGDVLNFILCTLHTLYYIRLWTKPGETAVPLLPGDILSSFPNIRYFWSDSIGLLFYHTLSVVIYLGTGMEIMANCTLKQDLNAHLLSTLKLIELYEHILPTIFL